MSSWPESEGQPAMSIQINIVMAVRSKDFGHKQAMR